MVGRAAIGFGKVGLQNIWEDRVKELAFKDWRWQFSSNLLFESDKTALNFKSIPFLNYSRYVYKVRSAARLISLLNLKADPFLALVKATVFMMTSSWLSPQLQPPASLSNHSGEKPKKTLPNTFLNGLGFES